MHKNVKRSVFATFFIFPSIFLLGLFIVAAIILNFKYSMTKWDAIGNPVFIGLKNYSDIFKSKDYMECGRNTIIIIFFAFLVQNPIAFLMAWGVTRLKKFSSFYKSGLFFPVVLSTVATATMFSIFLNGDVGFLSKMFKIIGLDFAWLSDPKVVLYSVMIPQLWQYLGIHFVMFLGGIQSINPSVLESAKVDGASGSTQLIKIVLPLTWPSIQTSLIYTFIGCLKTFDFAYVMTKGGPGYKSSFLANLLFKEGFMKNHYGYACAIAVTMFFYSLVFTFLFRSMTKRIDTV